MTAKQEKTIAALLTARSIQDAARQVGVSERSVRRWLKTEPFRERLAEARSEIFQAVTGRLVQYGTAAADVLGKTLKNRNPALRIRAAIAVLRLTVDVRAGEILDEFEGLADKLKALAGQKGNW